MDAPPANPEQDPPPGAGPVVQHGVDPADAEVVVVALHGRDQDPAYLIEHLVTPLASPRPVSWLLPAAPANSWYPDRADTDSTDNDRAIAIAIERIDAVWRQLARLPDRPVVLLGFSQGACLACEYAARRPGRAAALVALTGGLTGADPNDFSADADPRSRPALFAAGDADPWISVERVEATAETFSRAGFRTDVMIASGDSEHHIRADEVAAVGDLLANA